jgi:hypothetical protein
MALRRLKMENLARLNNGSGDGFWIICTGGSEDGAIVFDDCGRKTAFLLSNYNGRPAYSCVHLEHVDVPARYLGPVVLVPSEGVSFDLATASLGKLKVRNGRGLLTTLDEWGRPLEVEIAPYGGKFEACVDYGFSWMLMSKPDPSLDEDREPEIVYYAHSMQSWLNAWRSPQFVEEEEIEADDDLELEGVEGAKAD